MKSKTTRRRTRKSIPSRSPVLAVPLARANPLWPSVALFLMGFACLLAIALL